MATEFEFKNADATINEKIEVYGTNDEPWFNGNQIAKILKYKNLQNAIIKHVPEDDKLSVKELSEKMTKVSHSENHDLLKNCDPETIFIDELGLYALIYSSELPVAKEFNRWISEEVFPSIRKKRYNIKQTELEKIPKLSINVNEYIGKNCLYLLHIAYNLFIFGVTDDIQKTLDDYERYLKYENIVKIYTINNLSIGRYIQNIVHTLVLQQLKINTTYDNCLECFQTNKNCTLEYVLSFIEKYISQEKQREEEVIEIRQLRIKMESEIEKSKIELEKSKIELEKSKLELEKSKFDKQMELEKFKREKEKEIILEKYKFDKQMELDKLKMEKESKFKILQLDKSKSKSEIQNISKINTPKLNQDV